MYKKHFIEFVITALQHEGDAVKFEVKAPKHCKRLIGLTVTSPAYYNVPATDLDVMVSLSVNNKKMFIGNNLFALGYLDPDLPLCNVMDLDEPLFAGELVEGYAECLFDHPTPFRIWLCFTYLTDIDS